MALGYDGKLYILAFDHRGSFQKKMFGIEGDPTPEETERITDSKHLIYEGMVKATESGLGTGRPGRRARRRAVRRHRARGGRGQGPHARDAGREVRPERVRLRVRRRLRRAHREVRSRLSRRSSSATTPTTTPSSTSASSSASSAWPTGCTRHDRKFLFELLVPATDEQLASVDGDTDRYDAELRPELMRRAIVETQDFGCEVDIWKIEGVDAREDAEMLAKQTREGARARGRRLRPARPRRQRREGRPVAARRVARRGLRRLRHRPLDLVGRPEGLPRRARSTARRPRRRSPRTTCASSACTRSRKRRSPEPPRQSRAAQTLDRPSSRRSSTAGP